MIIIFIWKFECIYNSIPRIYKLILVSKISKPCKYISIIKTLKYKNYHLKNTFFALVVQKTNVNYVIQ